MKRSVLIMTGISLLATLIALTIEVYYIILQTEPIELDVRTRGVTEILLFLISAPLFAAAWNLKQKTDKTVVLILIAIGILGASGTWVFHDSLASIFFPKLSIITFLIIDFAWFCFVGFFLWVRRLGTPAKRELENPLKITN
ncbi:MAG: hypothetical protein C4K48_12755 [Candidatus Thorarchaeota archaeon]|nr:MAG: hypothetical protein C4K48_12755 [Candidatus Thorarchaeota archaeon]